MRFGLDGVNEVRELHGILNEEYWDVVATRRSQLETIVMVENQKAYPTISQFPSGV